MKPGRYLMLVLLAGADAGAARTPFQVRCEDDIGKTASVLTARQSGYSIDTHLSYKALTALKGAARANTYVLGLTKTESRVVIGLNGAMLQDPASGYECVAPHITVRLSYAPIVVYVGREFAPGTCAYDEIVAHELRHMTTYLEHLPKVEALVRSALAGRFDARPLYAPAGTAKAALTREIDTGWMPYIKAEMGKVEALQAAIDSPQEYARLGRACNGEIQAILDGRRRSLHPPGAPEPR